MGIAQAIGDGTMRWQSMLVPAALVALLACGNDGTTPRTVTEVSIPSGTRLFINQEVQLRVSPRDQKGRVMYAVGCSWSGSDPTVVAVAENGTITGISAGSATVTATCDGVRGSALVEVRGLILEEVNSGPGELRGLWGISETDVFAVGGEGGCWDVNLCFGYGIILHYGGTSWDTMSASEETEVLTGVWGSSASDVFAVGEGGTILHYDGATWTMTLEGKSLNDIWGSSAEDVFAAGEGILHFDGETWSAVPVPEGSPPLTGVWGSSSTDVFAVGFFGTILHYDGLAWTRMPATFTEENLLDVWGTSGENVFAVGEGGTVLHFDGLEWVKMSVPATDDLTGIWGLSANDVYVVGTSLPLPRALRSSILHYDGTGWRVVESEIQNSLFGLWGTAEGVFFAGAGPTVLRLKQ